MARSALIEMDKHAALTISEIRDQNSRLYNQLVQYAVGAVTQSIARTFSRSSKELKAFIQGIDLSSLAQDKKTTIKEHLLKLIKAGDLSKEAVQEAQKLLDAVKLPQNLDELLRPEVPLGKNPLFKPELERAVLYRLGAMAGLSESEADAVIAKSATVAGLNDKLLGVLAEDGEIAKQKAAELGLVVDLYNLADADAALAGTIRAEGFSRLPQGRVPRLNELVALDRGDWLGLLQQAKVQPPRRMSLETYAELLRKKVETLFRGEALFQGLIPDMSGGLDESVTAVQPLFDTRDRVFTDLDFDPSAIQDDKLKAGYVLLKRFSNALPGLNIAGLLDDKKSSPAQKSKHIQQRTALLQNFLDKNGDRNLLSLDYRPESKDIQALKFDGLSVHEQKMVLSFVKAYQRVHTLTRDITRTRQLVAAGYDSAARIAAESLPAFLNKSGLPAQEGQTLHYSALSTMTATTNALGTIGTFVRDIFNLTHVVNTSPSVEDYLAKVDGFAALFGSLDYCQCEHCRSIFSPAAYFVDLMRFVEKRILEEHFIIPNKENHPLYLKNRRPDLWDLELSCDNTNTLIPYLVIINEILENYVAGLRGNVADLSDRPAVEDDVYKQVLQNAVESFRLPFMLPLEKLHVYLAHFEKTPADVVMALGRPAGELASAYLKLSDREYGLVTQANTTPQFLARLYDIPFQLQANKIKPFKAQLLLGPMGLNRAELSALIRTDFVTARQTDQVTIKGEKKDQNSIQNDIENIYGLTYAVLDRMHRFIRLWRHVNWHIPGLASTRRRSDWTIAELDLVLAQLTAAGAAHGIDLDALYYLTALLMVQERFQLSVEELCSLWGLLSSKSVVPGEAPLFDRLFNLPDFVALDGPYPKNAATFVHPSFQPPGPAAAQADQALHRLMAGLRVSDETLYLLIRHLGGPQGLNLQNNAFTLTRRNLSLLNRHARLAEMLQLAIPDLFQLIDLDPIIGGAHVDSLDEAMALLAFHDWLQTTGFSPDDLGFITQGQVLGPSSYPNKDDIAQALMDAVTEENALVFADTLFAYFEEITEAQSREIMRVNPAAIGPSAAGGSSRWLLETYDPTAALNIPAGLNLGALNEADLRQVLNAYHAGRVIPSYLARKLNQPVDKTMEMIAMTGVDLADAAFTLALQQKGPPDALKDLAARILPLSVLLEGDTLTSSSLKFIRENKAIFGNIDFAAATMGHIRAVALYRGFLGTAEEAAQRRDKLHGVLLDYQVNGKFGPDSEAALGTLFDADSGLIRTLQNQIALPNTPLEAVAKLGICCGLARELGVGGDALKLMASRTFDDLARAGDTVLGAFRAKYSDEAEWQDKIEPFRNRILTARRDALLAHLTSAAHPQFKTASDLYHQFLIDVELDGCAKTSRVVAAVASLQLYVHRCLMNLELSGDLAAADYVHILPEQVPADEWEWRQNYRVWEANRKVFLYPENYIEPELRDNKTPLFEELEAELLQQDINEQTVLDAYAKYMRGFEEITHLKIVGAYHDKEWSDETDRLHLVGATAADPPVFYHRTVDNAYFGEVAPEERTGGDDRAIVWSPWRKIEVQIPVRRVAPIVFRGLFHLFWVEITTSAFNMVSGGASDFAGYKHKMALKYTTLRLDGSWTPPQAVRLYAERPFDAEGVVYDPIGDAYDAAGNIVHHRPVYDQAHEHQEAKDGYTLNGFLWDQVYPAIDPAEDELYLMGRAFEMTAKVDLYNNTIDGLPQKLRYPPNEPPWPGYYKVLCSKSDPAPGDRKLYRGQQLRDQGFYLTPYYDGRYHIWYYDTVFHHAFNSVILEEQRIDRIMLTTFLQDLQSNQGVSYNTFQSGLYLEAIANLGPKDELAVINGSIEDGIIDAGGDLLLLQGSVRTGSGYVLKRLGTTLSRKAARLLFTGGLAALLDIKTQIALQEAPLPLTLIGNLIENKSNSGRLDLSGPYGVYYSEIFFHIPFLIANHLNSQQKYREAQKWYHYIFNPNFSDQGDFQAGQSQPEREVIQRDWNWHYLGFRGVGIESLRDQLANTAAIEAYKRDPFNPHAIARLRVNAYQKTVVMKYIDNLLDWGDLLFARDTMESINEATLLYTLAADILGQRPAALGECGEGTLKKTYRTIRPLLDSGTEFLIEMEHFVLVQQNSPAGIGSAYRYMMEATALQAAGFTAERYLAAKGNGSAEPIFKGSNWKRNYTAGWQTSNEGRAAENSDTPLHTAEQLEIHGSWTVRPETGLADFGVSFATQLSPVFCIPENKDLRRYWDRVEDRLFKIRHCMNISGDRRQLALFAPEIDPGLLVRARAAGISIEDVLNMISGELPPYRFLYLIERAKSHAGSLQGLGSALLGALEKKDVEELNRLRTLHQRNIQKLTTQVREQEIKAAEEAIAAIERNKEAVTYRRNYYDGLNTQKMIPSEAVQSVATTLSSAFRGYAAGLHLLSGILHLIPELGSPFSLKYGGKQTGDSTFSLAAALDEAATVSDAVAVSAGLQAGFQRRYEEWGHQIKLADHELDQLDRQLEAARIRKEMAERSLEVHQKDMQELEEVYDLYNDKFSNFGLYTWFSTTLQRLYRQAYNSAYTMAKLAEQAFHFERGSTSEQLIGASYWDASRAGLLAGEQILADLQHMERRFIETNYRRLEITQSFSLTQINPAALIQLKEQGECTFTIAEIFFDLFYPGHYQRVLRAVRLTIPCITGPYTNISATLRLTGSEVRTEPDLAVNRVAIPPSRTASVATSTAQNDGGVFEMNFRDERYMPFEGAGAISSWELALPKNFRQFDYQTINDVVIHLSYTAQRNESLADAVERVNAGNEGAILTFLKNNSLFRAISFRQEFSNAFHRILHSPTGSAVKIELHEKHFPIFIDASRLKVNKALLVLRPAEGLNIGPFTITFNGTPYSGFAPDMLMGNLLAQPLGNLFAGGLLGEHTLIVQDSGGLAPDAPVAGDNSALDAERLKDIYLYVEYGVG